MYHSNDAGCGMASELTVQMWKRKLESLEHKKKIGAGCNAETGICLSNFIAKSNISLSHAPRVMQFKISPNGSWASSVFS